MTLIGFGEAAQAFAGAGAWKEVATAFDIKTRDPATQAAKRADYAAAGVRGCDDAGAAVRDCGHVISLVTADQALAAARDAALHIAPGALYFDMNSIAPGTKRAAAAAIAASGGRYIDVAVMAPVLPLRLAAPLLVSGPDAAAGAVALRAIGFGDVCVVGDAVGRASAIKMIRSVLIKGIEAVTAECLIAAEAAAVVEPVLASLGGDWHGKADYHLERMLTHGLRRAAEMEEVARTLEELAVEPVMTLGTIRRQRALGQLGLTTVPAGIGEKLAAIAKDNA